MDRKEYEKELHFLYDTAHNTGDIYMAWRILREIHATIEFATLPLHVPPDPQEQK